MISIFINSLASGTALALIPGMRKTSLFTIIFILLCPIGIEADEKRPEANVNERYTVERIEYNGIDEQESAVLFMTMPRKW